MALYELAVIDMFVSVFNSKSCSELFVVRLYIGSVMSIFSKIYNQLNGIEYTCKAISDQACEVQPHNYGVIFIANLLTLISDALSSTKLIIPWLFATAGIPPFFSGLLVPVREAFSMLPQIFIGVWIRQFAIHKGVYLISSIFQALALLGIMLSALFTTGNTAGWTVLFCVFLYSVSRAFSSVAGKDVLGKTISKEKRGQVSGYANRFAGAFTLVLGIMVMLGIAATTRNLVIFIGLASLTMLLSGLLYVWLKEFPHVIEVKIKKVDVKPIKLLKTDTNFRRFVLTRALLMSSGLATPYIVLMAQQNHNSWLGLGMFIAISGLANFVSSTFWGKQSDKNSKQVLITCAIATTGICLLATACYWLPTSMQSYCYALCFFLLAITHQGVRIGRSTYVVDLAQGDKRTAYVTVSNTTIGVLLLLVGVLSAVLSQAAVWVTLLFFAVISAFAIITAKQMQAV